jgi:hypothetical protein
MVEVRSSRECWYSGLFSALELVRGYDQKVCLLHMVRLRRIDWHIVYEQYSGSRRLSQKRIPCALDYKNVVSIFCIYLRSLGRGKDNCPIDQDKAPISKAEITRFRQG